VVSRGFAEELLAKTDVETNAPSDAAAGPPASAEKQEACKDAWIAADLNKNGVLDPPEAAVYAAALQVSRQPPLSEKNLNEAGFLKDCETVIAHE
jgi:hypothetical protein